MTSALVQVRALADDELGMSRASFFPQTTKNIVVLPDGEQLGPSQGGVAPQSFPIAIRASREPLPRTPRL